MDFHPDDQFPIMLRARNDLGLWGLVGEVQHGLSFPGLAWSRVLGQGGKGGKRPQCVTAPERRALTMAAICAASAARSAGLIGSSGRAKAGRAPRSQTSGRISVM